MKTYSDFLLEILAKLSHWKVEYLPNEILLLSLNVNGRSTNILTMEVMKELKYAVQTMEAYKAILKGVIIRSGKQNGFIYGADVEEFQNVKTAEEAEELARYGQEIFSELENLSVPTVAAINGNCLGGGLELALACGYRVARDDAKLGLPEVLLGIHPGFGGTVRLPRIIGDSAALNMMLTGKTVDAKKAKYLGLVDEVVPERHLLNAARNYIENRPKRKKLPLKKRVAGLPIIRDITARLAKNQILRKAPPKHYPSPYRIIELWHRRADYAKEAKSLGEMLVSETSRNLVRLFLKKEQLKRDAGKIPHFIKRVHVVGAGAMGADIAMWCASKGFITSVTDQSLEKIGDAVKKGNDFFKKKIKDPRKIREAADRLIADASGECAKKADLIIEAIKEDAEVKKKFFAELEKKASADAIFATNTSSIPLETIGESLSDPSRLVGLHFFNPATKMEVVEVIRGKNTDENIFFRAKAFTAAIDKIPITVKSSPGFLINRCLFPYILEAVSIYARLHIPIEDIDKSAVNFGMPMGPIELADYVGLDVCAAALEEMSKIGIGYSESGITHILKQMADDKKLGMKNGKGFYEYKNGRKISKRTGTSDNLIAGRLIMKIAMEAKKCLEQDIVSDAEEINVGMVFGTGFAPFRGGPLRPV